MYMVIHKQFLSRIFPADVEIQASLLCSYEQRNWEKTREKPREAMAARIRTRSDLQTRMMNKAIAKSAMQK
jgi:hypothetical protein